MKKYSVVELFPTIQGEGKWSGRAAVFIRLAGCNQWNGRPGDRYKGAGACAMWCDTEFTKGQALDLADVLTRLDGAWSTFCSSPVNKMVVITGGEPTMQLDERLAVALKDNGWFTAIETNGTIDNEALELIDHVCVSPKRGVLPIKVWGAHELKVVLPGAVPGAPPEHHWDEAELQAMRNGGDWGALYVQPQDVTDPTTVELSALTMARQPGRHHELGPGRASATYDKHVAICVDWVQRHPEWRLSLQSHKYIAQR